MRPDSRKFSPSKVSRYTVSCNDWSRWAQGTHHNIARVQPSAVHQNSVLLCILKVIRNCEYRQLIWQDTLKLVDWTKPDSPAHCAEVASEVAAGSLCTSLMVTQITVHRDSWEQAAHSWCLEHWHVRYNSGGNGRWLALVLPWGSCIHPRRRKECL